MYEKEQMAGTGRFLTLADKYTDIRELTPEIAREFIDHIEVYERPSPESRETIPSRLIYFNFVGKL